MNNKFGYTLLEVALVTVVLGIIAAFAIIKYQKYVASDELEKEANSLYSELRGIRSLAFKYDGLVKVKFNATAMQCTTWVDTSQDGTFKYKKVTVYNIKAPVVIGHTDNNLDEPYTDGWWADSNPLIVNGVQGEWKDSITVIPNSRGEYCRGGIYLYSPRLKDTYYFIGINSGTESIELKKWTGAGNSWKTL
jgi:prepilin-type N-terminal cleavage/methylation domain-containing protein